MIKKPMDYLSFIDYLYQDRKNPGDGPEAVCREITFQVTSDCNLKCAYCYEKHKCSESMTFETGKKIVDYLFDDYLNHNKFLSDKTAALVLSFIGGETLLEIELIENICDYYFGQGILKNIPFIFNTRVCFPTNGLLWFDEKVQKFIKKYKEFICVTISIDGTKELHDKYRIDKNNIGSYDTAYAAYLDGYKKGFAYTKMTFVPGSFDYIASSVIQFLKLGCKEIHCNYAYEPVYSIEDSKKLFEQLKIISDYIIDNNVNSWVSILDDTIGEPLNSEDKKRNYCGGTGSMVAYAPDGVAYPCIRYAPISIGKEMSDKMRIGNAEYGLYVSPEEKLNIEFLNSISIESQSEKKCIECQVASGCGYCSGYNYEETGTPNKRITNICFVHKARVLASCYYFNKRYVYCGDCEPKKINLSYDEASYLLGEENASEIFSYEICASLKYIRENNYEYKNEKWILNN